MIDPDRQFVRSEATENNRMNCSQSGACQHGYRRFGDHRHINDNRIPFADALAGQRTGKCGNLIQKLFVCNLPDGVGYRTIIDDRGLIGSAAFDMTINGVITGVHLPAGKPLVKRGIRGVQNLIKRFIPSNAFGGFCPEFFRIFYTVLKHCIISTSHTCSFWSEFWSIHQFPIDVYRIACHTSSPKFNIVTLFRWTNSHEILFYPLFS
ncbi:MAG: hypothetical protein ACD_75C00690G0002 [uncultured bacterium]|nr:MAG: hypothetical protein ACD_75C00690G0002 [uncultured bacterium]